MTWCIIAVCNKSRSISRRRSVSRSPDRVRDNTVYNSPLKPQTDNQNSRDTHRNDAMYKSSPGTGDMLTREEFERLQHSLRMESSLPPPSHPAITPTTPLLPPSVPIQHPPPVMYTTPVAPPGQHFPPHGTVVLPQQPIMMPIQEQLRLYPGPGMEPSTLLIRPPHEVYPQFGIPARVPFAPPLGPPGPQAVPPGIRPLGVEPRHIGPPPGVLHHGAPPVVLTPGNTQTAVRPPVSNLVHLS